MPRLVIALFVVAGLCAPALIAADGSVAEAQVWKLKKKSGTTAKTVSKPKSKGKRTARPSVKKKTRSKPRKVELVPDDSDNDDSVSDDTGERGRTRDDDEADEPIVIQVEEVFD